MGRRITKAQAAAFRDSWKTVNAAELAELRATSPEQKLRQLSALVASADALGWTKLLAAEEAGVRERWCRLRRRLARD